MGALAWHSLLMVWDWLDGLHDTESSLHIVDLWLHSFDCLRLFASRRRSPFVFCQVFALGAAAVLTGQLLCRILAAGALSLTAARAFPSLLPVLA